MLPADVDGRTSGVDIGVGLGGVHSLVSCDGVGIAATIVLVLDGLLALDVEAGCFSSSSGFDRSPDDKPDGSSRVLSLDDLLALDVEVEVCWLSRFTTSVFFDL